MFHLTIGDNTSPHDFYDTGTLQDILVALENSVPKPQNGVIHVAFIELDEMRQLNSEHRGVGKPTDILSFHYFDDYSQIHGDMPAADIVMCLPILIQQAEVYGLGLEGEFYKLLIHGLVHVMGYDHENEEDFIEMEKIEKKVWDTVFPSKSYPSSERFV